MIGHPAFADSEFDQYAGDYDSLLSQGLAVSGEGKEYFAEGRVAWLKDRLDECGVKARRILDFGCGTGDTADRLQRRFAADCVIGVDPSSPLVQRAALQYGRSNVRFHELRGYVPAEERDLVYCNGVFHHIPPRSRSSVARYIWSALRPGGVFAFWENNPWNPGTRYVMSRIAFDRDAVTLTSGQARELLQATGFHILRTDYLFVFPRALRVLRSLEGRLSRYPIGAQYLVLARKATRMAHCA
ncbi:MAG TPA: methyltransferase domain-containing protein [Nitrospira sp.]|nr:methyltransferase domain-containing protein [Nitrospira sp.]